MSSGTNKSDHFTNVTLRMCQLEHVVQSRCYTCDRDIRENCIEDKFPFTWTSLIYLCRESKLSPWVLTCDDNKWSIPSPAPPSSEPTSRRRPASAPSPDRPSRCCIEFTCLKGSELILKESAWIKEKHTELTDVHVLESFSSRNLVADWSTYYMT